MTTDEIELELTNRGLLPCGPGGPASYAFMSDAGYADIDRFRGALLGSACGDALGRPVESRTPEEIQARYGWVRDFQVSSGWIEGHPGTITDDTILTVLTAQALLDSGDSHPAHFGRSLIDNLDSIRGIGRATRRSIERHAEGRPWWQSGVDSAGNGVAMRIAPLGLAFGTDLTALRRETARNAVVTHASRLAVASGIMQAYAVARLTRTPAGTLNPMAFLAELVAILGDFADAGAKERRPEAGDSVLRLADRVLELGDMLDRTPSEVFALTHNGAFVLESLPAAIWSFLSNPDDPEEAIITAVNGGYDADTVGAMTGAMAGAYNGAAALPERWLCDLEDVEKIKSIAERLHHRFVPGAGQEII